MLKLHPSAGYAIRIRAEIENVPGALGRLTSAIGRTGGNIEALDLVEHRRTTLVRELSVQCQDVEQGKELVRHVRRVRGVRIESVSDRTFESIAGQDRDRVPLSGEDARRLGHGLHPGVGRVSSAIASDPELVWELTIKRNSVAVLTDGSAVLGLGDLGPEAVMPVMEGKAMLFKELAGIDAYPICVRAASAEQLITVAGGIAPGFGAINLEDIAAPRCFEVEQRLRQILDIPVFHDDQHGTAVVVAAALLNATRVVRKSLERMTAVIVGVGTAGSACAKLLMELGIGDLVAIDRTGILAPEQMGLNVVQRWIAERTNRAGRRGGVREALGGFGCLDRSQRTWHC